MVAEGLGANTSFAGEGVPTLPACRRVRPLGVVDMPGVEQHVERGAQILIPPPRAIQCRGQHSRVRPSPGIAAEQIEQHAVGERLGQAGRVRARLFRPREVIEAALAHVVQNKVEAAYARSDLFERRRRLMDDRAAYLEERRSQVPATGRGRSSL